MWVRGRGATIQLLVHVFAACRPSALFLQVLSSIVAGYLRPYLLISLEHPHLPGCGPQRMRSVHYLLKVLLGRLHGMHHAASNRDVLGLIRDCERLKKKYELRARSPEMAQPAVASSRQRSGSHTPPRSGGFGICHPSPLGAPLQLDDNPPSPKRPRLGSTGGEEATHNALGMASTRAFQPSPPSRQASSGWPRMQPTSSPIATPPREPERGPVLQRDLPRRKLLFGDVNFAKLPSLAKPKPPTIALDAQPKPWERSMPRAPPRSRVKHTLGPAGSLPAPQNRQAAQPAEDVDMAEPPSPAHTLSGSTGDPSSRQSDTPAEGNEVVLYSHEPSESASQATPRHSSAAIAPDRRAGNVLVRSTVIVHRTTIVEELNEATGQRKVARSHDEWRACSEYGKSVRASRALNDVRGPASAVPQRQIQTSTSGPIVEEVG